MLTILGRGDRRNARMCDGMHRRDFLTVGGMLMGGLTLSQLLRAEASAGVGRSHKAIINIFLPGGPPHQDMWDLKPDAPAEIRGEFNPIDTSVPGIQICELFPNIARMMDKFAIVRSIVNNSGGHDAYQCMTGRKPQLMPPGGWPQFGAWASKVLGPVTPAVPPNMSLFYNCAHKEWGDAATGGFLGLKHSPFKLIGGESDAGSQNMKLNGISIDRLQDRRNLLGSFDKIRREIDNSGSFAGNDAFTQQAMGILTSSKLADALDISQEDPKLIERYGKGNPKPVDDGAPRVTENFLVARRLIEAGARVVSLNFGRWDWHGKNFVQGRGTFPMLDQATAALVQDLHDRGMLRDVSIVVWGEFGRTPKINKDAGRDHWERVSCALLAGGGMKTGQVIGATNRLGEEASDRPVTHQEIFATLYHNLGFRLNAVREFDLRGRPQYPVEPGVQPMRELVG